MAIIVGSQTPPLLKNCSLNDAVRQKGTDGQMRDSRFYKDLAARVDALGGYHNAHLHLDRAFTDDFNPETHQAANKAHLTLPEKHGLISEIHNSEFYTEDGLKSRLQHSMKSMIRCQTQRADSVIDVSDDGLGLRGIKTARKVAQSFKEQIDFRIGAYSPLGFESDNMSAFRLMEQAAEIADFIGCLPERDDTADYPNHIGYEENCRRMIDLAARHGTFLHVHTDQKNLAQENATERLLDVLEQHNPLTKTSGEPRVWAVHMISPSAYDEPRWESLVERLKTAHVGVICCPSAAIGMRQIRSVYAPTHNSIARVLELCAAGVHVRLGSDNSADMLSPSTTTDLTDEVFVLSAAVRFYDVDILASLACGVALTKEQRQRIKNHLEA